MELYLFGFLAVMVLTTLVLKGIFCWIHCSNPQASKKMTRYIEEKTKELSSSKSRLMHMEIPMEDIERTSTPVPMDEKRKHRTDFQSDV